MVRRCLSGGTPNRARETRALAKLPSKFHHIPLIKKSFLQKTLNFKPKTLNLPE